MNAKFKCTDCLDDLSDYADQTLNPAKVLIIDTHLQHCADCSEQLQMLWQMQGFATQWQDEAVPNWSRKRHFFESNNWLLKLTMVSSFASATAIILVLILGVNQLQISTDEGLSIAFKTKQQITSTDLNTRIALLEKELSSKQQHQMQVSLNNLSQQQIETNQLLLRTILQQSRKERQEDFKTVLTSWGELQLQRDKQTQDNLHTLYVNQIEDQRNIQQLNKFIARSALEGNKL